MQHSRPPLADPAALRAFPDLVPAQDPRPLPNRPPRDTVLDDDDPSKAKVGHIRASVLSFMNMHLFGELLVDFLRARKRTFIDRLNWNLPQTEGMEFDQYDTPLARWIVIHEFGEVLGGIRMTPTTARCGIYTYMLRDAQKGLLDNIPSDVLFFEAPVSGAIWEASRLFIVDEVHSQRRLHVQSILMDKMSRVAQDVGADHVIGIVPAVWSRWLRRLDLDAVPVGPKFAIDGSISQAALFNTTAR